MNKNFLYTIYSHSDADGGIAAALFTKFLYGKYGKYGWNVVVQPVNHVSSEGEWSLKEILWPCAILDFTIHPSFLSNRFFLNKTIQDKQLDDGNILPHCYWIDHHPTGSSYPFLSEANTAELIPNVITKWDTSAISTPGLLRKHFHELEFPGKIIQDYEEFIDLAEIIDGAMYVNSEAAHDFSSSAVKLQTLFNASHGIINKEALYKKLVKQIVKSPSVEDLFDSDLLYSSIIDFEEQQFNKQLRAYKKVIKKEGIIAFSDFSKSNEYKGMGRFVPYLLYAECNYALHVFPSYQKNTYSVSCGINPWNKPKNSFKHLGNYFAKNFAGGGHAYVAGGKVNDENFYKIRKLIDFLNEE
ncbi:hypothetical protein [Spirobacillus cienkowskii]|jgi:oligoribonuclease NrnB/cAMP/cGMP phosphodiesterase (DHH superfamily)|uniref:DHHA1 domain-containing protein n=1 Tax=Spirobacillus cienkowskii TaxID=495820 RepID=A0A369KUH0_9BACT|nr:MAG: hypothetical protein DCC88_10465 [Spirobacillus cienkowskii]